jgi:hypothetical protein
MSELVAYIDESKSQKYVLVAVVLDSHLAPSARKQLQSLRMRGQRRLHMRKESTHRKTVLLKHVSRLDCVIFAVTSSSKSDSEAREKCLRVLSFHLLNAGVKRIEIERDESFEKLDKSVLKSALLSHNQREVTYRHLSGSEEPILWAADVVAWAIQNGLSSQFANCQITQAD